MKRTHLYEAEDGSTFTTAAECKYHEERTSLIDILSDLKIANVEAAFERTNVRLADAIERAGNIIATKRRQSGDLKHGKKVGTAATMETIKQNMKDIS